MCRSIKTFDTVKDIMIEDKNKLKRTKNTVD